MHSYIVAENTNILSFFLYSNDLCSVTLEIFKTLKIVTLQTISNF